MEHSDDSTRSNARASRAPAVYISMPSEDGIDLVRLWGILRAEKWLVAGITTFFAVVSIAYALLATPVYRAEVLLAPVTTDPRNDMAALGGLASLAGLNLNFGSDNMHAVAVLQSNEFTADFIERENLLPVLFSDLWDGEQQRWRVDDPAEQPDVRDGIRVFNKKIRSVSEEGRTGLVTLSVEWTDPETAADWAQKMVVQVNERIRKRHIEELEQKLAYLNEELNKAQLVELRQAISRVIEDQISAMMLAQARTEYAFKVIDPPFPPKLRSWPKRTLIVLALTIMGFLVGVGAALAHSSVNQRRGLN